VVAYAIAAPPNSHVVPAISQGRYRRANSRILVPIERLEFM